jgi:hypothetical protein
MIDGVKVGRCSRATPRAEKQGPSGELFPSPNGPRPPGEGVVGLRSPGNTKITEGPYPSVTSLPALAGPPEAMPFRQPPKALEKRKIRSFFINLQRLYWECRGNPAMAINRRRNKPFGPGGSTRRLHPSPVQAGFRRGRTRIDEGVKGALLLGMVPPLSGQSTSCKRQLCSGCSGRVSGLKNQV